MKNTPYPRKTEKLYKRKKIVNQVYLFRDSSKISKIFNLYLYTTSEVYKLNC